MAKEIPVFSTSFEAAGDLSAKQYYFVKLDSTAKVVICAAATDKPIGVLQNAPTSGQMAEVMVIGITPIKSGGSISVDAPVGTDSNGKAAGYAAGTDTTKYLVGRYIGTASAASGDLAPCLINCASLSRGA